MGSLASQKRTFFYNLQRYGFKLSQGELRQIIITVLIIAFVWSFNKWGDETFDFATGIMNFALGAVFAVLGIVMNQLVQRIVAVYYGYDPIYEYGILGLMIALVVTFASKGVLIFFLPGAVNVRHLSASRLGEFRYYTNDWEWAKVGFMGPFMNVIFALLLSPFKESPIVSQLMLMNLLFAFYSLIPLPGNLGLYLFYPHLYFWTFTVFFVIGAAASVYFLHPLLTLGIGLVFGAFAMYYHFVKIDNWFG